ncbi:hypothetical protein pb186bvf_019430 [Paramecium bursaria]
MDRDVYTFASGPAIIFKEVLEKAKSELLDWQGLGIGVMEMSHRSPELAAINQKANENLRKPMEVHDNYRMLFMQGGSTIQAAAVPMNLLQEKTTANYLVFGKNGRLGYLEAQKYCIPNLVTPLEESQLL